MSKMVVIGFPDEASAYAGRSALQELHGEGSITVYSTAVVARAQDGTMRVEDSSDNAGTGTVLGMLTGALIGVFGGPAGVVAGATVGTSAGAIGDLINLGVGSDFVTDVGQKIPPGTTAVCAEIDEHWSTPLDTKMAELGGTVYRRWRADVEDEQIDRDVASIKADYHNLKSELKESTDKTSSKISAHLEDTGNKLSQAGDRASAKVASLNAESKAKIGTLDQQISSSTGDTKAKLEAKKADVQAGFSRKLDKLKSSHKSATDVDS